MNKHFKVKVINFFIYSKIYRLKLKIDINLILFYVILIIILLK
jgi:hypothetical protein